MKKGSLTVRFNLSQGIKIHEMKADKVKESDDYNGQWDNCTGQFTSQEKKALAVTFSSDTQTGNRIMFFTGESLKRVMDLKNTWIDNQVINKSGISSRIWPDEALYTDPNTLRRRLESRAETNRFTEEEKLRIIAVIAELSDSISKALEINKDAHQ